MFVSNVVCVCAWFGLLHLETWLKRDQEDPRSGANAMIPTLLLLLGEAIVLIELKESIDCGDPCLAKSVEACSCS